MTLRKSTKSRFALVLAALLPGASLCVSSCRDTGGGQSPVTSSETHFLKWCDSEAACGKGYSCLCGTCTQTCEQGAMCERLAAGAECMSVALRPQDPTCPDTAVVAFCDMSCAQDEDCAALGGSYRCDRGFCRALNDGCQSGTTVASEVVLLGDTFIANGGEFTAALEDLARSVGALAADENYRDYATSTLNNLAAEPPGLSAQYANAQRDGAVSVIIMNGGGADVLLNDCPDPITPECPILQDAIAGADLLWEQMAQDEVKNLVFFFYPDYVGDERIKATMDVLRPLLQERCANAPLPCHWLDLRPTYAGHYDEYVLPIGRNPTPEGAQASAEAVWGLMQRHCIAQ